MMKKSLFTILISLSTIVGSNAQDISDALNYSGSDLQGTARFRSMSGAFGALGGDLSAIHVNPASSAVFNNSYFTATLSTTNKNNDNSFLNNNNNNSLTTIDIAQGGGVFVFKRAVSDEGGPNWRKFTLGINYQQQNNFDNEFVVAGTNTTSIDSYFLNQAQGVPLDLLQLLPGESISDLYAFLGSNEGSGAQQAFLGYQSFILEPLDDTDPNNTTYTSNIAPGSFDQEYFYITSGQNSKLSFNFGTQYKDKLYLGLNLNSHTINYNRTTVLYEANNNVGSIVNDVRFENNLSTFGTGFSFQIGAIAKLHQNFRIGASYESPTWYRISEETTQFLNTLRDDAGNLTEAVVHPEVINVFPDYRLQTPTKLNGSAAILFGKKGLISFDYTHTDYANIKFRPSSNSFFAEQNNIINNSLKSTSSYRIGGEFRVTDRFSLRGGYRLEESPYKNENIVSDLDGYSFGLGYSFGKIKLDAAFDQARQTNNFQLYNTGLTDSNSVETTNTNVTVSVSFSL